MRRDKEPGLGTLANHSDGGKLHPKFSAVPKTGQNQPDIGYTKDEPSVNTNSMALNPSEPLIKEFCYGLLIESIILRFLETNGEHIS